MAELLGTVVGQIKIDIRQAVASYAALRAEHASTLYALRGTSQSFRAGGLAMAATGAILVGAFAKAAGAAANFERKMDFFGAVTASTSQEMAAASKKAIQLGQDTIFSAGQIADSFVELGKAGISATDIINGVGDAVAHLGAAADIPLADAANIITAAVQTFNLKAQDAVHVADLLAGAANASIVEVQDLGVSLKYVGGVAASVHIPIESVIDAISLLGKAGIRGSTAGTSLRQILLSLQGNSAKATSKLKELGIITQKGTNLFIDQTGHIKPLAQVFQILQDHTKNLTEAQRLQALKIIFNNRAIAAATILTQAGAKGFADMDAAISKTTAADVARKRLDNLSGDMEILRGNIETLLIQAGTPFQNFLRKIVQGLTFVVQIFGKLPAPVQTAIFAFAGIAGALLLISGTFLLFFSTIFRAIEVAKQLGIAFKFLGTVFRALRVATIALNTAFLTNPIFLIIAAVALLVIGFILLYKHSKTFRDFLNTLGRFFVSVWGAVLKFFAGVPAFFSKMWDSIKGYFSGTLDFIKRNWKNIIEILLGPLGIIVGNVGGFRDKIVHFFIDMWDKIKSATITGLNATIHFFAKLPETIAYWVGFAIGRAIRIWFESLKFMVVTTKNAITAVVDFFRKLPGYLATFFTAAYHTVVNIMTAMWHWLASISATIFHAVVDFFAKLPGRIAGFFTMIYHQVVNLMTALWHRLVAIASAIYHAVVNFFALLPGRIASIFSQAKSRGLAIFGDLARGAANAAKSMVSGIGRAISNIPGLISGVFHKALAALRGLAGAFLNEAKKIGSALWRGFKDGLGIHSPSFIEKAMYQITDTLKDETAKTGRYVTGLQGLGNKLNKVGTLAYSAAHATTLQSKAMSQVASSVKTPLDVARASALSSGLGAAGKPGDHRHVEKHVTYQIHNPRGETTEQSLFKTHRKAAFLGLEDDER